MAGVSIGAAAPVPSLLLLLFLLGQSSCSCYASLGQQLGTTASRSMASSAVSTKASAAPCTTAGSTSHIRTTPANHPHERRTSPLASPPGVFEKDFTRPMEIPEEGIEAAVDVLRSGRLFRYSCVSAEGSQVALVEKEFAQASGARFALGVNSCSSAILIALLSVGVEPGDEVLTNAFTFTAVPSTILRLGAEPVLVECCDRYVPIICS